MPRMGVEQWGWNNMEELLQCPVCLEPPYTGIVVQCRSGHHICSTCKLQLDECPLCKCSFGGTRNFVVEELMRNYLVLKNTMLLTAITGEGETETVTKKGQNTSPPVEKPNKISYAVKLDKGVYPCRIAGCNTKLPIGRLLNHLRTFHETVLFETKMDDNKEFKKTWQFPYDDKKPITRMSQAAFVSGIGLVFLNVEILMSGHIIIVAQMGAQLKSCQNFKVVLKVHNDSRSFYHTTSMCSCRENMINLLYRKACLLLTRKNILSVLHNKRFNCTVEIKPNPNATTVFDPAPNMQLIKTVHAQRDLMFVEEQKLADRAKNKTKTVKNNTNRPAFTGIATVMEMQIMNGATSSTIVVPSQSSVQIAVCRRKRRR